MTLGKQGFGAKISYFWDKKPLDFSPLAAQSSINISYSSSKGSKSVVFCNSRSRCLRPEVLSLQTQQSPEVSTSQNSLSWIEAHAEERTLTLSCQAIIQRDSLTFVQTPRLLHWGKANTSTCYTRVHQTHTVTLFFKNTSTRKSFTLLAKFPSDAGKHYGHKEI